MVSNIKIKYGSIVGKKPVITPLQIYSVKLGQFYRQRLPDQFTKNPVAFSTLKPDKRLDAIMGKGSERVLPLPPRSMPNFPSNPPGKIKALRLPNPKPLIIVILPQIAQELWRKVIALETLPNAFKTKKLSMQRYSVGGRSLSNLQLTCLLRLNVSRYIAFTQDPQKTATDATKNFAQLNALPKRIVFFRDGVSEGTFESVTVSGNEISAIREGVRVVMRENGINHEIPKLTYIIVGKRYHITFYPESGTEANDGRGWGEATVSLVLSITPMIFLIPQRTTSTCRVKVLYTEGSRTLVMFMA
ncbi:MAG: hypothetical protein NXY57DRAFT_1038194 [Lentinula lateritia]|nr:MAG: hypothetical protein NXY57DRAFT_1038194 [Lentinula lateritia]